MNFLEALLRELRDRGSRRVLMDGVVSIERFFRVLEMEEKSHCGFGINDGGVSRLLDLKLEKLFHKILQFSDLSLLITFVPDIGCIDIPSIL